MEGRIFLSVFMLCVPLLCRAQNTPNEIEKAKIEALEIKKAKIGAREKTLAKSLSFLSTGNSFSSLGNFSSISTDEKTIKGSLFFLNSKYNMYTVTIEAGATDGIGALFDEGTQGANVGIGIEHRFLFGNKGYVSPGEIAMAPLNTEREQILDVYNDSLLNLFNKVKSFDKAKYHIDDDENNKLRKASNVEIKKLFPNEAKSIEKIEKALDEFVEPSNIQESIEDLKKSLSDHKQVLLERTKMDVDSLVQEKSFKFKQEKAKKLSALAEKENKLTAKALHLNFFSIGLKATNKSFKFFDEALNFDKQIKTKDYTSQELNLSYNFTSNIKIIKWNSDGEVENFKPRALRFFSGGLQVRRTDNLDELDDVKIQDTKVDDLTNNRVVLAEQSVKKGDYKKDLKGMTMFLDYYHFLGKSSKSVAIHLNPKYTIKDSSKPVTQFQVGLLIPFKKKDDEKSSVNIEIFYQLKDVFDTLDKFENGFFKRNIVGIQTSFPFNLNF